MPVKFEKQREVHYINYVLYHEIIHLKERKHNDRFWKMIINQFNDYVQKEKELFVYWFLLQKFLSV